MKDKIKKLETLYNIKVIAIDDVDLIFEYRGYRHKIRKCNLHTVSLDSVKTMLPFDYQQYLNNTVFKECPLEVVDICGDTLHIINTDTYAMTTTKRTNIHIDTLLNATNKINKYKAKIIKTLGNNYIYDKCYPHKLTDKVIITCPIHGDFEVSVNNVIYNQSGCPHCANEYRGYSRSTFVNVCKKKNPSGDGVLYVIKIKKHNEEFLKIGITSFLDISQRFKELNRLNCKIDQLVVKTGRASDIYNLEKYLHKHLQSYKYIPTFYFHGRQECYEINSLAEINTLINKKWKNYLGC